MTKNLDSRKYKLIQEIMKIEDESLLSIFEQKMEEFQDKPSAWHKSITPIRESISIEEMKQEQDYRPIKKDTFFKLAEELNIEESIEELLSQLD